jgi:hypothetical protein
MAMSRKDFESLAADIRWQVVVCDDSETGEEVVARRREIERFVRLAVLPTLRASNSRFDTERFLTACGF